MKKMIYPVFLALFACQSPQDQDAGNDETTPERPTEPARPAPSADAPDSFLGLTEEQAIEAAKALEIRHRVIKRDGESFPMTMDYWEDRFNFVIEGGIVTKVTRG